MPKSRIELTAYISFLVFAILLTPLALTWILAGFGLASHDEAGGWAILLFAVWPVVLIVFGTAAISSLICLIIGGSPHLRVRLLTLWASILLPSLMVNVHPPSLASIIGILGFGLALSLPIIWSVKK